MEKVVKISCYFFRFHYLPFFLVIVGFLGLFPILFGTEFLEMEQAAFVVERIFTILGLVLFIPLYLPDSQKEILAVIRAKKTSYGTLLLIRFSQILFMLLATLGIFLMILKVNQSQFDFWQFFLAEFATVFFLGGLLNISYAFFHYMIPSTMIAIMYYVLNMFSSKKYFGSFYLFTLAESDWWSKTLLFLVGFILLFSSILLTTHQRTSV